MKIVLEDLPHQKAALDAISKNFPDIDTQVKNNPNYANPLIKHAYDESYFIDIKMETGTGKTYVYTRMMYELHKRGIFKFVIVVPNPSIKEGTKNFIESDYAKRHFNEYYENVHINLNVINAGDFASKGGRREFPTQLSQFVEASKANTNQIEVLLINSGMLYSKSMTRDDYDQTLGGGENSPVKAIAATRPVIIIDEPHHFANTTKSYKAIQELHPQSIVRFGATFPLKVTGKGRDKETKHDYYRGIPQYNLNAVESFNQGLVKEIDVIYPNLPEDVAQNTYKIKSTSKNELVLQDINKKNYSVSNGENLNEVNSDFEGNITYNGGNSKGGILSNGLEVTAGMKLIPGTFTTLYQEKIIKQAINEHFRQEEANFLRINNAPKIKTLSLFFIDSVDSYGRRKTNGNGREKGWLIQIFEKLLREKLQTEIHKYKNASNSREAEYCDFLQATLNSLNSPHQKVYAGYFSGDRTTKNGNEDVSAEVDDILKNKEKLISFKDEKGNWITRRFLFSQWTLRDGWDNPNVFVIAKLRTSGSENSKIQEVGRGLRLPVDENGKRVHQDEFISRLSFLVGYDEKDFANKLVDQINSDVPIQFNQSKLDDKAINMIVDEKRKTDKSFDEDTLLNDLGKHHIIDFACKFNDKVCLNGKEMSGFEALEELYPCIKNERLADDKVSSTSQQPQSKMIKLKKENWRRFKKLWKKLVKRSIVIFDRNQADQIEKLAQQVFSNSDNYVLQSVQFKQQRVDVVENESIISEQVQNDNDDYETMKYGTFLKQIALQTSLQPTLINKYIIQEMKHKNNATRYINEKTMNKLINDFNDRFNACFENSYSYQSLDFSASTAVYDYEKDDFVDEVSPNLIGRNSDCAVKDDDKYLYDRPPLHYDSNDPELDILKHDYSNQKITVYGKLPKYAIKISRYDSGTTSPDFIFEIKQDNQEPKYLMVETKAKNMREDDKRIIQIQRKYFEALQEQNVYYKMATSDDQVQEILWKIENE